MYSSLSLAALQLKGRDSQKSCNDAILTGDSKGYNSNSDPSFGHELLSQSLLNNFDMLAQTHSLDSGHFILQSLLFLNGFMIGTMAQMLENVWDNPRQISIGLRAPKRISLNGQNSFSCRGATMLSSLPSKASRAPSISIFKSSIKNILKFCFFFSFL